MPRGALVLVASGALFALMAAACEPASRGEAAAVTNDRGSRPISPDAGSVVRFEATVVAPDRASQRGKPMLGALVKQDDGVEWVVDYWADSPFRELAGRRVEVEGEPCEPAGQRLMKPHLRVRAMRVIEPDEGSPLVMIGAEERLEGRLERYVFPPGTKLEGEAHLRFVEGSGAAFWLSHSPEEAPLDAPVTITARRVEPSPFVARPGGPYLWVVAVDRR